MCKKKREAEKSQLPKRSKPKAVIEGEDENKQKKEIGGERKESTDGVKELENLEGADAKAKKLYGAKFQEAIIENEKTK